MKSIVVLISLLFSLVSFAADMNSPEFKAAVDAYKFWYPTVSMEGIMNGMREAGVKENKNFFSAQAIPEMLGFTANQDTPYAAAMVDLTQGPFVVDMPAGLYMGLVNDHNQRWIVDMGIPGADGGRGGKYLLMGPGYTGSDPQGFHIGRSHTNKIFVVARIIPKDGSIEKAQDELKNIKIYPLSSEKNPKLMTVMNINGKKGDMTLLKWEDNIMFWQKLAKVISEEPMKERLTSRYDDLKKMGIEKGKAFKPNKAQKEMMVEAAKEGKKELLKIAFESDRTDRVRWPDRKWEWLVLTSDPGWAKERDQDMMARDRYFSQAIVMSPAMLKRDPTAGSLYWGAFKDAQNNILDGGKTYKMTVPLPVPARLFWSVTVYDTATRSLIQNGTAKAALRSLAELKDLKGAKTVDLYFGPTAPAGQENRWVKTMPGKTWFSYFRIYGPEAGAFDQSKWRPGDFIEMKDGKMASAE